MNNIHIDRDEIIRRTEEYGGPWGLNHTRRLLHLISIIGEGQAYDADALWVAAHLHDWGGYSQWAHKGVDHALRSRQVAESYLTEQGYPDDFKTLILDCIGSHHYEGSDRSVEVLLLRDADALDFLGVVGVLRDFSKNPQDLRKAYAASKKRHDGLAGIFYFEAAKAMAAERIKEMEAMLSAFEQETFGYF
jgi:uncharacterized protein